MEFASSSVGTAGLTTGIIGTALGVANSNILPGIFGGGNNQYVNREAFDLSMKLASAESQNALYQAELSSEKKMIETFTAANDKINSVYTTLSDRIREVEKKVDDNAAAQSVINCKCSSAVTLLQNQVEQLFGMTKLVIPNASISPGWES